MRLLTSAELVQLWETGQGMPIAQRAVTLAEAAGDGTGPPAADLSLGDRDHRLMVLRCQLFGTQISGLDTCGQCGADLDVTFDLGPLVTGYPAARAPVTVRWADRVLHCRVVTTADVIAAAGADGPDFGDVLVSRCVTVGPADDGGASADGGGASADGGGAAIGLPAPVVAEVMTALAAADPLADVRLAMTCVECGHQWDVTFDIASFLWTEICAAVERILGEVHVLASAYGWSEAEVLAVGPRRRQYYLEAVGG
jgi:hypothetical protein